MDDDALDHLYDLPLDEFTAARNELATSLRRAGERDAADEVARRPKPSVAAWTVNQLARREPSLVRELLGAGDELRTAQAASLAGGDAAPLRSAAEAQRRAVDALVDLARRLLESERGSAPPATLERIATTLRAGSVDEQGRAALAEGRLAGDLVPSGFGAIAGFPAAPRPTAASAPAALPAAEAEAPPRRAPRPAARRDVRLKALEERRRAALAEARRLRAEADDARRSADAAARRAARAEERLAAAEEALADARAAREPR